MLQDLVASTLPWMKVLLLRLRPRDEGLGSVILKSQSTDNSRMERQRQTPLKALLLFCDSSVSSKRLCQAWSVHYDIGWVQIVQRSYRSLMASYQPVEVVFIVQEWVKWDDIDTVSGQKVLQPKKTTRNGRQLCRALILMSLCNDIPTSKTLGNYWLTTKESSLCCRHKTQHFLWR
jgi:hypothetical protein